MKTRFTAPLTARAAVLALCVGSCSEAQVFGGSTGGEPGGPLPGGPGSLPPNWLPPTTGAPPTGAPATGAPTQGERTCAATTAEAMSLPVDLYILEDQSASMEEPTASGISRWNAVKRAFRSFVESPSAQGLQVGLGFFPTTPAECMRCRTDDCLEECGCTNTTCINGACTCSAFSGSCRPGDYGRAVVPIAPLPAVAPLIVDAYNRTQTNGSTPTRPALQGAIQVAREWRSTQGRRAVIALATDGIPAGCDDSNSIDSVAAVARSAAAEGILTFVIGVGPKLADLNAVAAAGGTSMAFLIENGGEQELLLALKAIQGAAASLSCEYAIPAAPAGAVLDPGKVKVEFTSGTPPQRVTVPRVDNAAGCAAQGGWYYDDANRPTRIILCRESCGLVNADAANNRVALTFECKPPIID
jgi:hypothetical protein